MRSSAASSPACGSAATPCSVPTAPRKAMAMSATRQPRPTARRAAAAPSPTTALTAPSAGRSSAAASSTARARASSSSTCRWTPGWGCPRARSLTCCRTGPSAAAAGSLHELLGLRPSVRSLEHMSQAVADSAAAFADSRPTPPAQEEGALLVFTADGTGVPLRRPPPPGPRRHPRRGKGAKANKQQMAYVGAAYTSDRFGRTPEQVVQALRAPDAVRAPRPRPCHKHVWAEMTQVVEGAAHHGRGALCAHLAAQRRRRDPSGSQPTVCLCDGERALWDEWLNWFLDPVGILDIFHVLERLWDAAYCFPAEQSKAAEQFVTARLRMLLEGRVGGVSSGLRQLGTKHRLRGSRAKTVTQVANYLDNHRDFMRSDAYLAAGYAIGSGVAEGACRHLVKDRLEQTGMRWRVAGAQAMLYVRATYLNGAWEAFWEHRIAQEQRRLDGPKAAEPTFDMAV